MSDLIERLRAKSSVFVARDCKEAADEIERQAVELESLRLQVRRSVTIKYHDHLMQDWQVVVVDKDKEIEAHKAVETVHVIEIERLTTDLQAVVGENIDVMADRDRLTAEVSALRGECVAVNIRELNHKADNERLREIVNTRLPDQGKQIERLRAVYDAVQYAVAAGFIPPRILQEALAAVEDKT